MELGLLINKTLQSILAITLIEGENEFLQDDTVVFETDKGELYQLLINYDLSVKKKQSLNELEIIGEYSNCDVRTKIVLKFEEATTIKNIFNYTLNTYHFASKFTDETNDFTFGISFGFDELKLIDNAEFDEMLLRYDGYSSEHLS